MSEASAAFRHAVELDPEDQVALSHLGHTSLAAGRRGRRRRLSEPRATSPTALRPPRSAWSTCTDRSGSIEERWRRRAGIAECRPRRHPRRARRGRAQPDVGQLDDADRAFERLRELDEVPGHEAYPAARDDPSRNPARAVGPCPRAGRQRLRSTARAEHRRRPRSCTSRPRTGRRAGAHARRGRAGAGRGRSPSTAACTPTIAASAAEISLADLAAASRAASAEWFRCPACEAFVYHKRLKRNLGVCPECNHHFRVRLSERLAQLLDAGQLRGTGRRSRAARRALVLRLQALLRADS